ncbi:hypothetical protein KA005_66955 [bacterium]|nr:hypothetical protein [bacterium]
MFEPMTLKILFALFGFLYGSLFPMTIAYAFLFIKKRGLTFTTIKVLALRLLWMVLLIIVLMSSFAYVLLIIAGGPVTGEVEEIARYLKDIGIGNAGALGMAIGIWGWLLVFILNFAMSFRHRAKQ